MKEKLQKKLQELQAGLIQAQANVNAFTGAIQVTQQLLNEELAEEAKPTVQLDPATPSVN